MIILTDCYNLVQSHSYNSALTPRVDKEKLNFMPVIS